jgi:hypothetical protein
VVRIKRIPINAVIKIGHRKDLLIGRHSRGASICLLRSTGLNKADLTFYTSEGGCATWFPGSLGSMHYWSLVRMSFCWYTDKAHITPWSMYVIRRTSPPPKKWRERAMGSGSSPSSSGNLGGSGRSRVLSQVAVDCLD